MMTIKDTSVQPAHQQHVFGGWGGAPQMGHTGLGAGWVQAGLPIEATADQATEFDPLQKKAAEGR
jgi:hypothetical protein